jgi:hypothetical protein
MPRVPPPPSRGRPRGSRNRLRGAFLADLAADWESHGRDVIRIVRIEDPATYFKTVASLMPRELAIGTAAADLNDDELDELIAALRERHAALVEQQARPMIEAKRFDMMATTDERAETEPD